MYDVKTLKFYRIFYFFFLKYGQKHSIKRLNIYKNNSGDLFFYREKIYILLFISGTPAAVFSQDFTGPTSYIYYKNHIDAMGLIVIAKIAQKIEVS